MPAPIRVLALSGSLRRDSFNTAALRAVAALAPGDMQSDVVALHGIPNSDAADALLIATPEYNRSLPGVLRNTLDWTSRGGSASPLRGKPAAILGAGSRFGTLSAQTHLRQILQSNQVRAVSYPEVMIDQASTRFDESGALTDERFRDQIHRLLAALLAEATRGR